MSRAPNELEGQTRCNFPSKTSCNNQHLPLITPQTWGPITTSFNRRRDRDAEGVETSASRASRGRKRGEGCPLTIRLGVWGSVVSSPSGVRPGRKWILCIFQVRKKPSRTPSLVFLSDGAGPPNVTGPGKTPPSRRACHCASQVYLGFSLCFA